MRQLSKDITSFWQWLRRSSPLCWMQPSAPHLGGLQAFAEAVHQQAFQVPRYVAKASTYV